MHEASVAPLRNVNARSMKTKFFLYEIGFESGVPMYSGFFDTLEAAKAVGESYRGGYYIREESSLCGFVAEHRA